MTLHERAELLEKLAGLQRDAHGGNGRLVLVSGEAGIGKTSLVDAFCEATARTRILRGSCDATTPPRAFGPLIDIAETLGGPLARSLGAGDRDGVLESFLAMLRQPDRPTTIILEDLHWADDATLDLVRVLGRRLRDLPVLVTGTCRDDEVAADHPLRLALGDIPAGVVTEIKVPPLSTSAIALMARGSNLDPAALHAITAGNPFFATEVIALGGGRVPPSVRDAVLARAARLSPPAQRALRAASVLEGRWLPGFLEEVAGCDGRAIEECRARGLLRDEDGLLAFRHDLAQQALRESLGPAERARLHARALDVLRSGSAEVDPAQMARHAVEAGDRRAILILAPEAGNRAAALGAHREARAHYEAALRVVGRTNGRPRAELLEAYARECRLTDRIGDAIAAQTEAIDQWHFLEDVRREGDCLQALSLLLWLAGDGDRALVVAEQAVALLDSIGPHGAELARAYAALGQRLVNAGEDERGTAAANQALRLADTIGEERVAVHALTTIGLAETFQGLETGWARFVQSAARAKAAGLEEEAARALINLVETGRDLRRYDIVDRYRDETVAYVEEHDVDLYRRRLSSDLAELALERGRWDEAADRANALLAERGTAALIRAKCLSVIGRLRSRCGEGDAWAALDEALALFGPAGDPQDLCPTYAARTEAAWLQRDTVRAKEEAGRGLAIATRYSNDVWWLGEAGFWAWKTGLIDQLPAGAPQAYVLHAAGRHRDASHAWRRIGCPYLEAQALADSSAEADLRHSLALLNALDAQPLAKMVRDRLRAIGARGIARGPRRSTRQHPALLTEREVEVLAQVSDGRTNAQIAERLVVSPKTVDHHVSAILRKLGVHDRAAAARLATKLATKDGGPPPQT